MIPITGVTDLKKALLEYVAAYPKRMNTPAWWREPLLVTARADERFDALPEIAAPDHLLPRDLLPGAKSVIVFFLPFTEKLNRENLPGKAPCRNWGRAYVETNQLIANICQYQAGLVEESGFKAEVTPPTANFNHKTLMSRWSHKHLAHISGLGRFGEHCQIITPAGCSGRMGSLVTNADFGDHALVRENELCLARRGYSCNKCREQCPVDAFANNEYNRKRCWQKLNVAPKSKTMAGLPDDTHVCGKCQMMLPCSFEAPRPEAA